MRGGIRGDLIVIEGLDGVGKSTVGEKLAERLDYAYFDSVPQPYRRHLAEFQQAVDSDSFFLLMLSMLKHLSGEIARRRDAGQGVVLTRYYHTTLCYHRARHRAAGTDSDVAVQPDALRLEAPSHGFFLHADEAERVRRLQGRGALSVDDRATLDAPFRAALLNEYAAHDLAVVDVTHISPDEAVAVIAGQIGAEPFRPGRQVSGQMMQRPA